MAVRIHFLFFPRSKYKWGRYRVPVQYSHALHWKHRRRGWEAPGKFQVWEEDRVLAHHQSPQHRYPAFKSSFTNLQLLYSNRIARGLSSHFSAWARSSNTTVATVSHSWVTEVLLLKASSPKDALFDQEATVCSNFSLSLVPTWRSSVKIWEHGASLSLHGAKRPKRSRASSFLAFFRFSSRS